MPPRTPLAQPRTPTPEDTTNTPPIAPPSSPGDLLTVEQAAAHMNVSTRYVRRLVTERRIAFFRLGRCVRFRREDLTAHIEDGRVEPITRAVVWNDLRRVA